MAPVHSLMFLVDVENNFGDYLSVEPTGQGHKLKPIFQGPFVVTEVLSDHLIRLRDPERKRNFQNISLIAIVVN
jgi:hypothetical protein